ncbi:MAG: type I-G CRISPR-associated protein Csb2 [Nitriliruptorales bacterium]
MRLVLRQSFPLGRFHATPWRANPFDDPNGEWPPSPWRLTRAVAARWFQWRREVGDDMVRETLDPLVQALCTSTFAFRLPSNIRRVESLRTYQPAEWGWDPAESKKGTKPQVRRFSRKLARDNFWAVPPDAEILWFIDGERWTDELCEVLDRCLERVAYFGRAESTTSIARVEGAVSQQPNVVLQASAASIDAVPVLTPQPTAASEDALRSTDDKTSRSRSLPPGATWMYAERPARPPARERRTIAPRPSLHLVQFAMGIAVAPEPSLVCALTERFRSRLLKIAGRERTHAVAQAKEWRGWSAAPAEVRGALALLAGKNALGHRLEGHQHLRLGVWFEDSRPARLLAWRYPRPFEAWEVDALYRAAERDLSWQREKRAAPAWTVRLVPLDSAVPPPPGLGGERAAIWEPVTPYVPPRHQFRKDGSIHRGDEVESQVTRELRQLGVTAADEVEVRVDRLCWTSVHVPQSERGLRGSRGERRGFFLRLEFREPVSGPIALGHSSHYGLGLFQPAAP